MDTFLLVAGGIALAIAMFRVHASQAADANKTADKIVCPHCQTRGHVTVKLVTRSAGISGGKAAGAVMTGGLSVGATGLSKNVPTRELTCGNCKMKWDVA